MYGGKFDFIVLDEWTRGMEKIFVIAELLEGKGVNIWCFYLVGEIDIWCSTVKNRLQEPKLTWSKFLNKLRATFYPVTVHR